MVGFVNPDLSGLVVIELKKPGVPARAAFDENLTSYKHPQNGIPALFVFNALLIASNGTDSRVGLGAVLRGASARDSNASSARTSLAGRRWR